MVCKFPRPLLSLFFAVPTFCVFYKDNVYIYIHIIFYLQSCLYCSRIGRYAHTARNALIIRYRNSRTSYNTLVLLLCYCAQCIIIYQAAVAFERPRFFNKNIRSDKNSKQKRHIFIQRAVIGQPCSGEVWLAGNQ